MEADVVGAGEPDGGGAPDISELGKGQHAVAAPFGSVPVGGDDRVLFNQHLAP
jgi:hypothetical protein